MGKYNTKTIDSQKIYTKTKEIWSANGLEVEAGTNGFCGGDSGHGSRTYIRITDLWCTDMRAHVRHDGEDESIEIIFGGDCELVTLLKALKFIRKTLKTCIAELEEERR